MVVTLVGFVRNFIETTFSMAPRWQMLWLGINGFLLGYVLYPMIQEGRTDYPWFAVLMFSVTAQTYVRLTKQWDEEKKNKTTSVEE
jgi:hypothetical protein